MLKWLNGLSLFRKRRQRQLEDTLLKGVQFSQKLGYFPIMLCRKNRYRRFWASHHITGVVSFVNNMTTIRVVEETFLHYSQH